MFETTLVYTIKTLSRYVDYYLISTEIYSCLDYIQDSMWVKKFKLVILCKDVTTGTNIAKLQLHFCRYQVLT